MAYGFNDDKSKVDVVELINANAYTKTQTDTLLAAKSDNDHTHDDRYYTESEVDGALDAKVDKAWTFLARITDNSYISFPTTAKEMLVTIWRSDTNTKVVGGGILRIFPVNRYTPPAFVTDQQLSKISFHSNKTFATIEVYKFSTSNFRVSLRAAANLRIGTDGTFSIEDIDYTDVTINVYYR